MPRGTAGSRAEGHRDGEVPLMKGEGVRRREVLLSHLPHTGKTAVDIVEA